MQSRGLPATAAHEDAPLPTVSTGLHRLRLLPGMAPVLDAIRADVRVSSRRVLIETYIYQDRRLGRRFAGEMVRAARRGAGVRLLYDPLGSHLASATFFEDLRAKGIGVRAYRPPEVVLEQAAPFPRDHSRVIVTDGAAYTGGAAWADNWLPRRLGGAGWYDVCLRVEGPVVEDFAALFEQRWREANGESLPADFATGDRYPDLELVADTPFGPSLVEDRYRRAIRAAKRRVWIENAYFFPGEGLLGDLFDAAARGVDVQIVIPAQSDLEILERAARAEMATWLDRGLRVLEYEPAMLHAKLAVVDDAFATVGSFNINPTSTAWANEVALFVFDPAFVAVVARRMEIDRSRARRVREGRPGERSSLWDRVLDQLSARLLRLIDRGSGGVLGV